MTHHQKTSQIRKEINNAYQDFKKKYPVVQLHNLWGALIFIVSLAIIATTSYLWLAGMMNVWLMVIINAFVFGILHEMEHDLIHWMYFKNNKFIHHLMLLVIWLLRPLTINPWIRRHLHYHHHKYSGTLHDVEERGVTNGEKWSIKRLILTPDLLLGGLTRIRGLFHDIEEEIKSGRLKMELGHKLKRYAFWGLMPITIIAHIIIYLFVVNGILNLLDAQFHTSFVLPEFLQTIVGYLSPVMYIILLPNVIRQFCLHFITSNIHYFADVEDGNVIEQTQVLNVWWTFPFQVFCFFFGWTHAIHHFVVNETFYVRHFTRRKAQEVLKKYGVRFNDLGTFARANRFHEIKD